MKILVLGAGGMLGHMVGCFLKEKYGSRVVLAARRQTGYPFLDDGLELIDLCDHTRLRELIARHRPCTVINCAAINDPQKGEGFMLAVNSQLPLEIASFLDTAKDGSRLIHISTDGVFHGDRGSYNEGDVPDAQDAYGQSKMAGEVTRSPHLTVRTSIIGPDPLNARGLMHWFFSQRGVVHGFTRVFWNGVTTLELAKFIDLAVERGITGLYHLCSQRISKYELLITLKDVFNKDVIVHQDGHLSVDHSLVSKRSEVDYKVPNIDRMVNELKIWMLEHPKVYQANGFRPSG